MTESQSEDVTNVPASASGRTLRLRYAGRCRACGVELPAGTRALYDPGSKCVTCAGCAASTATATSDVVRPPDAAVLSGTPSGEPPAPVVGPAGASARRIYERRKQAREDRIRTEHPRFGGLILALSDDPQSTRAWGTGARGEERLAGWLDLVAGDGLRLLHDRRIPGTRANIDHIAVAPTGVYVIDAKRYAGRPDLRVEGGLLRPRVERLVVGRRDCTKLVDGVRGQVDVVRSVLADNDPEVPVHGVLCFVEADWPLVGGDFMIREVQVLWPKKLQKRLLASGSHDVARIAAVHASLAQALPAA